MLERLRAGVDVVTEQHGGVTRWQPLKLREIAPQFAEALSLFRAQRALPEMRLAGRPLRIATAWAPDVPDITAPWCATMRIDRTVAELIVPHALLDLIFGHTDPSITATTLRLDHAALLLEFALSDTLEQIETALGWSISLTSVAKGSGQRESARDAFVTVAVQLQGAGKFWCQLRLEPSYLLALSRHLDRISGATDHHINLPLPVHLRWAAAELTMAELRGLGPGDIILTDHSCQQPGTAVAVFGEHLVAPVELLRTGCRFAARPRLPQGTGLEWTLDRGRTGAADRREGTTGEVPVRLFFELGQLEVDSGAVRQLKPGEMMALTRPLEEGVDILANGARVGRGQITKVGDAIGIRVTRI